MVDKAKASKELASLVRSSVCMRFDSMRAPVFSFSKQKRKLEKREREEREKRERERREREKREREKLKQQLAGESIREGESYVVWDVAFHAFVVASASVSECLKKMKIYRRRKSLRGL